MTKILSSANISEMAQLRGLLEEAGIVCFMRNEIGSGLSGAVPLAEGTPELWVENDEQLAEALQIKATSRAEPPVAEGDWVCPTCGETSEPQFTSCWKCGAAKPGQARALDKNHVAKNKSAGNP